MKKCQLISLYQKLCYNNTIIRGGVLFINNIKTMPEEIKSSGSDPDVEANKTVAALSYISILFLVPLLGKRDSKFAQFHAKQGLILFTTRI